MTAMISAAALQGEVRLASIQQAYNSLFLAREQLLTGAPQTTRLDGPISEALKHINGAREELRKAGAR